MHLVTSGLTPSSPLGGGDNSGGRSILRRFQYHAYCQLLTILVLSEFGLGRCWLLSALWLPLHQQPFCCQARILNQQPQQHTNNSSNERPCERTACSKNRTSNAVRSRQLKATEERVAARRCFGRQTATRLSRTSVRLDRTVANQSTARSKEVIRLDI